MPNTSGCGGNSEIRPQNWPHPIPQAGSHWQTCCSPVTSGPTGLETCVDAENSLCIEDSATGDLMVSSWTGLSGVPGLGVSVPSRPGKTCLRGPKGSFRGFKGVLRHSVEISEFSITQVLREIRGAHELLFWAHSQITLQIKIR